MRLFKTVLVLLLGFGLATAPAVSMGTSAVPGVPGDCRCCDCNLIKCCFADAPVRTPEPAPAPVPAAAFAPQLQAILSMASLQNAADKRLMDPLFPVHRSLPAFGSIPLHQQHCIYLI